MTKEQGSQNLLNRREFLIGTAGLALTTVLPACSRTAKIVQTQPTEPEISSVIDRELKVSCHWVARGDRENSYALFKKTTEAATDFSWLSRGDRVLIKIALNSGKRYPATTDPWSVHCMVNLLKEKSAGKIWVGDQSGFGTVQWTKDRQEGSSRQLAKTAGILKVIEESGTEPCFFEEYGWDAYRPAIPEGKNHWEKPIMIPAMLDKVDHIIYLPRVSSHILAGNTLGFKLPVGFLRSDSRGDFHKGGRYFYAMYEEINHVPQIASKLRLIVSSGRSVLTLIGPNEGPTAKPDYGLVLASEDLLAHEMLAYAWLQWNRQFETSSIAHITMGNQTKSRSRYNKRFSDRMWPDKDGRETPPIDYFEPGNLYNHPAVVNYLKRMGGRPRFIAIEEINKQPDGSVIEYLKKQLKA
ncbi:MAG: DUF362 domain-containing protein [Deltaproteobacteria bacterium]|nr:DUF362 domain-containing protein [Deltaproteobacteria bacterium]